MTANVLMKSVVVSAACPAWVAEALRLVAEKEKLSVSALLADLACGYVTARGFGVEEVTRNLILGVPFDECSE
ncbi:hypothetical protein [Varibaculum cambriense]|uniref:hypothetical protein n=1 Tax=Varibaculum cambriense TaxID=184870 RepID=UPI002554221F|nr:hypothetical protein [Varibaculum cambriense]MDK8273685.1 hypothetical protein [Varibaculum cambriense]